MRSWRKAAMKVHGLPMPMWHLALILWPRGAHTRSGAMVVFCQVSSSHTRREYRSAPILGPLCTAASNVGAVPSRRHSASFFHD